MSGILDIFGFNHYPTRDYAMVADEHLFKLDQVRLLPMLSQIPFVVELESGIWHGYHYNKGIPYPDHYRFMMLTVLAGGAVAWTWYMFHDRDNWFMSPVNNLAKKHLEVFDLFRQFAELVKEHKPEEWERCTSSALTFSQRHYSTHVLVPEYHDAFETARAFYEAGIDHTYFSTNAPGDAPQVLFYDGLEWLDRADQQVLVEYMEQGGHLVVFQKFPQLDEKGQPCNLLEIPHSDGVDSQGYMNTFFADYVVHLGGHDARVELPAGVLVYQNVPGEPITASRIPTRGQLNDNVLEEYQYLDKPGERREDGGWLSGQAWEGVIDLPWPPSDARIGDHRSSVPSNPHRRATVDAWGAGGVVPPIRLPLSGCLEHRQRGQGSRGSSGCERVPQRSVRCPRSIGGG